jgi:cellobiose PTS system EIIA component
MDDTKYQLAFQIILHAGNSKSKSMMAMQKARSGNLDEAANLVAQANNDLTEAHLIQTALSQAEICGSPVDMNIIMVHAQDHLGMAIVMSEVANEILHIYRTFR